MYRFLIAIMLALNTIAVAQAQQLPLQNFQPGPRLIDGNQLNIMVTRLNSQTFNNTEVKVATADDGTSQTLTAAMITGGNTTFHVSTGGATPTLTLPLATAMNTALPGMAINSSYLLRIINSNSGTATVATNTGWTTSGTLTLATTTWREFVITKATATTYTITSVGTGTNS